MFTGLTHLHSLLRYLILIGLVASIIHAIIGLLKNKPYDKTANLLSGVPAMMVYLQFVLGLVIYTISPKVKLAFSLETSEMMKNSFLRFIAVEHLVGMIIGVILIAIGRIVTKKATLPAAKYKRTAIFYGIGLLIIVLSIPWPFKGEMFEVFGWF